MNLTVSPPIIEHSRRGWDHYINWISTYYGALDLTAQFVLINFLLPINLTTFLTTANIPNLVTPENLNTE